MSGTGLAGRTVLVLCDAAEATGLGHFVRCTSLASALADRGADVRFVLPDDSLPHAVQRVRSVGWQVRQGPALETLMQATDSDRPVVVVDSYRLSGSELGDLHHRASAAGGLLAVVDDLADRSFSADLVVNQNVGAEGLRYPGSGRVLAGPDYALLRPEFPRHRDEAIRALEQLPDVPRRILVLFGGTDAAGMAWAAAVAATLAFPEAGVRVVSGAAVPRLPERAAGRITRLDHVDAIHEEMLAADLVLSAGGTTLWELCCLARPMAVVAVAENQQPAYDEMARRGAILPAGRTPGRDPAVLAARLSGLTRPGALRAAAREAARLTDGRGAERVAGALADLCSAPSHPLETT